MKKYMKVTQDNEVLVEQSKTSARFLGRSFYTISIFALLVAAAILILFFYWTIQTPDTLVIKNSPVPVERKVVQGGDVQILKFNFCKKVDIEGQVEWSLVSNKVVIFLPSYIDTLHKTCAKDFRAPVILPFVSHTDTYHFHYVVTYTINPIKETIIQFDTQSFKIEGSDKGK